MASLGDGGSHLRFRARLVHRSGLQPSGSFRFVTWGFTPGCYRTGPSALNDGNDGLYI
jgi:hypothetical protein